MRKQITAEERKRMNEELDYNFEQAAKARKAAQEVLEWNDWKLHYELMAEARRWESKKVG